MRRVLALTGLLIAAACSPPVEDESRYERVSLSELPGFAEAEILPAVRAFASSCRWLGRDDLPLGRAEDFAEPCAEAPSVAQEADARRFVEDHFVAVRVGDGKGLVTGYYEPVFAARAEPEGIYTAPVLAAPEDLVSVDLGSFRDDLKGRRIAGRVKGGRLVPYDDRAALEAAPPEEIEVLGYMQPDDLFFLQIQGSGVLDFAGEERRIGYAAQNGHPYKAIGKTLVEEGAMPLEEVTMQSIRAWLEAASAEDAARVRATNPSYVFFTDRGEAEDDEGPLGTAGVPLTPLASVAVDRTVTPLGTLIYIAGESEELGFTGLAAAQDTGGAIRGENRADLFLGRGDEAGEVAGRLKLEANLYVLLPKTARLPGDAAPGA
ncbi:murein transglycosylase A [Parvularcula maris]|uniref:peptidoglycan lytic exotransglycosylase n=1 Tax=Parvularcula maris TaxID=2965077 RepID=A0A9X2L6K6_9PROT|nr:MltA domain-containing protein [Parvularcula maris]MCQ8184000.1 MltA domain-containing protein [Parvularcula maris]